MGCSSAKPVVLVDIREKSKAPGVKFEEHLEDFDGDNRNVAAWFPEGDTKPKALVFISHGLNEHALCYYNVAIALVQLGYGVFAIDHASHGKSDGPRGIIKDHTVLYENFIQFVNKKRKMFSDLPIFILAHSMGTLVAMMAVNNIPDVKAIVFSGCAIDPGTDSASPFGMKCLFSLGQTSALQSVLGCTAVADPGGLAAPLIVDGITNNKEYLASLASDVRRNKPVVTNKTAHEVLKLTRKVKAETPKLVIPFMCIHGADDNVCLVSGSEFIYRAAGTDISQRRLQIMPGCKHECFHEAPPKDTESIKYVTDFIESHFHGRTPVNTVVIRDSLGAIESDAMLGSFDEELSDFKTLKEENVNVSIV